MNEKKILPKIRLFKKADGLMAAIDDEEPVPVRLLFGRPISARDQHLSIMAIDDRKELAWLNSLADLDVEARRVAQDELQRTYRIARITRVKESSVNHGHRYVKVETDRGDRHFNLREPGKNITWLSEDHLVIRDSMGNRYEIESMAQLDEMSRLHLERVM